MRPVAAVHACSGIFDSSLRTNLLYFTCGETGEEALLALPKCVTVQTNAPAVKVMFNGCK